MQAAIGTRALYVYPKDAPEPHHSHVQVFVINVVVASE